MALPITVPYVFGNVTSSIPLTNLDSDFSTIYAAVNGIGNGTVALANVTITGGSIQNVSVTLDTINNTPIGNTTPSTGAFTSLTDTGLTSGRVTYATTGGLLTDSANMTFNGTSLTLANDASISGLTVGKGGGSVGSNTAVGANVLATNSSGTGNSGFGINALTANTTGIQNTSIGTNSLVTNTTGGANAALGWGALYSNTTASNNTAVGYQAGYSNITNQNCTFVGYQAGYASTGDYNCLIGRTSGQAITTGTKNTVIGSYSGNNGGLDIRTSSNYIVLSDGDGNPRGYFDNNGVFNVNQNANSNVTAILKNAGNSTPYGMSIQYPATDPNNTTSWFIQCTGGSGATTRAEIRSNGGLANYSANNVNLSDERTKKDIVDAGNYLDKICAIPVRTFLYKDQTDAQLNLGVIAQEVEKVAPELVDNSGFGKTPEDGIPLKAIYQTDLQYALMKAIQELNAKVTALEAKLGA
jgi:hypothetical protein